MLSRTANSLFWIGRYIERIEHLSRYINAQYLSSSDAPRSFNKQLTLESMLFMAGATESFNQYSLQMADNKVIFFLTLESQNPYSIKNYIALVRENARGVRDNISIELWEAINRFYHATNAFTKEDMDKKGPYDFCKSAMDATTIIKGVADNTLLRNQVWSLMRTGIHLERATQITQILVSKLHDVKKTEGSPMSQAINTYHWAALLRSAGGLDMSRHYYGTTPNREKAIDFLVLTQKFPKSVLYNLEKLKADLKIISDGKPITPDSVEFTVGKLTASMNFLTLDEILEDEASFLENLQETLDKIGTQIERQYLTF